MSIATTDRILVHGTCICLEGRGALLRGRPGAGKSDLALRFVSQFVREPADTGLVSDDQVLLTREGGTVVARPPAAIAGRLEVRGIGIVGMTHCPRAELALIVDLTDAAAVPRLPPDPLPREDVLGVRVPVLAICPFELSSPVKLKLALGACA